MVPAGVSGSGAFTHQGSAGCHKLRAAGQPRAYLAAGLCISACSSTAAAITLITIWFLFLFSNAQPCHPEKSWLSKTHVIRFFIKGMQNENTTLPRGTGGPAAGGL